MFKKLGSTILREDKKSPAIIEWISGFVAIVLIRSFFETFSNPPSSGIIATDAQRVQYLLFFLATVLLITLVVSIFTKQKGSRVINLALYGLPIIFLAPTIDILARAGGSSYMDYIFDTHGKLLLDFLTFFGPLHSNGITLGIRIEVFAILCAIGWYVWAKRRNVGATVGAVLLSYTFIFTMLALPGFVYSVSHLPVREVDAPQALFNFMKESVVNSNLPANMLHGTFSYGSYTRLLTLGFSAITSQLLFVLSFVVGLAWFWYAHKKTMMIVLSNARGERVLFYLSLLVLGGLYAHTKFSIVFTWVDWLGFVVVALSWFSAWMFSVHTNDVADIEIDKTSNQNRPLPKMAFSHETMRDIGFVWLSLSIVGAYIAGYYVFYLNIIFLCLYYVYSMPPLRLKRVPMLSSFLISLACLATVLAGFFFVAPNKILGAFPVAYTLGIIILLTLGVNIRDIKDVEGDRAVKIQTLPVIFGAQGKQIVGVLLALSFLLSPLFFPLYITYLTALPSAIVGYWLCIKEPYRESLIFALFFVFCATSIIFYVTTL